ncbi:glycosyltransferase family 9 protein [Thiohalomonas denitrificans]|uniref:Heptosyltransferase I n=1 Tax=Thiohalomonas denitrificans TaxID=415747 RepID=A0A1G5PQU6_9GAMM|nr:glycosyltransferase family 9 protein [Thiohalomonas denitrificans]SCZ51954.1 heptosyltransferase I [Thiohalomonas denitrificans]
MNGKSLEQLAVRPPDSVCLLRLSALGDITHMVPVVRTLQAHWPDTRITWIIGKLEYSMVGDLPGIEFVVFDKGKGWQAYGDLRRALRGRSFDLFLHMQVSLRASLVSLLVRAPIRLGFDRERAKDAQWLFTNQHIDARQRQHVLDGFFGFAEALGIRERVMRWDIPIPEAARRFAAEQVPTERPVLVISPCSSDRFRNFRNWPAERYARVVDYAAERYGMQVVLTGGPSELEREYGEAICARARHTPINLIGATNLKQLLAVLERARVILSPDSGPAHMGTAVDRPVIGLYATSNTLRTGPYLSQRWVVDRYPEAIREKFGKELEALPWGIRVRDAETMSRIHVADVIAKLDAVMAEG